MSESMFARSEFEKTMRAIGRAIDYPPQPDIAGAVRRRITTSPRRPTFAARVLSTLRRPVAAGLAAALALTIFVVVWEPAREAVAGWLGLDDVRITYEKPPPRPVGAHLDLGDRVSLTEGERRVSFHVLVPGALGAPDEVYFDNRVPGGMVSLLYTARAGLPEAGSEGAGLILSEFEADLRDSEMFMKFVRFDTTVAEVTVRGVTGYWIAGPHQLAYIDAEGDESFQESRLSAPALVWQEGGRVFRIESGLERSRVLEIAGSLQ